MRILIVDDYAGTKCFGIIEECKKRNIQVEVVKAVSPALQRIYSNQKQNPKIDGIILDMALPTYENGRTESLNAGEFMLRKLERMG